MSDNQAKQCYCKYRAGDFYRSAYLKIFKKRVSLTSYAGRTILDIESGNDKLKSLIESGSPCFVTRLGANELNIILDCEVRKKVSIRHLKNLVTCAGFFPDEEKYAFEFSGLMLEKAPLVDIAVLYFSTGEEFVLGEYAKNASLVHNRAIEPWYTPPKPWTAALAGKRVLVIHPFEETILSQYEKRDKLFPGTDILPEFELKTIKAVQTIAGQRDARFSTWFDALDYMYTEALKQKFDVAILGCGAYGYPLAAKLKEAGKAAIHLGGATQLLFGIKGTRWDNHPVISKFYNDAWVRPSNQNRPPNANKVEGGCYW